MVDGQVLELQVDDEAEEHPEHADDETAQEEVVAAHPQERHRAEVRQHQIGLASRRRRRAEHRRRQCQQGNRNAAARGRELKEVL